MNHQQVIENKVAYLQKANNTYRLGQPIISDAEYDELTSQLERIDPDNAYLKTVEPEPEATSEKRVRHSQPMLSTDKCYTPADLQKWINRAVKAAESIGLCKENLSFKATAKLDGMAACFEQRKLITRGNGLAGNDVTNLIKKGVRMPMQTANERRVVGEIVMVQSYFDQYLAQSCKHPRNVVVGAVAADTVVDPMIQSALDANAIRFIPFDKLDAELLGSDELVSRIDDVFLSLTDVDYPTDGIVIEIENPEVKTALGSTSHHHNWMLAFKVKGDEHICKVQSVSWQVGRTGKISPVVNIEPTMISGAVVAKVSGHHAQNILNKGIDSHAEVAVLRSGEVIPFITKVAQAVSNPRVPSNCPCCGFTLEWENDFLVCNNPSCTAKAGSVIRHFFSTIELVKGFGSSTVDSLVSAGKTSISEILMMTASDFQAAGISAGIAANLSASIQSAFNTPLEDWRLLAAFGIHTLGRGSGRRVLTKQNLNGFLSMTEHELSCIEGIGKVSAKAIVDGRERLYAEIASIISMPWTLIVTCEKQKGENVTSQSPFNGKTVVFTGKLVKGSRSELQSMVAAVGGKPSGSLSKRTDYLITGSNAGSKKAKAQQLGVAVLSESEFMQMLEPTESENPTVAMQVPEPEPQTRLEPESTPKVVQEPYPQTDMKSKQTDSPSHSDDDFFDFLLTSAG